MSRKTKSDTTGQPAIPTELIDYFVKGPMTAEAVEDASAAFKKALIERAMGAELSHHLGYWPGTARPVQASDWRNGKSAKTVLTGDGPVRLAIRSEERRVGKECVSTCRSRWAPYHSKKKTKAHKSHTEWTILDLN